MGGQEAAAPQISIKEGQQAERLLSIQGSWFHGWGQVIQIYGQPKNSGDPKGWTALTSVGMYIDFQSEPVGRYGNLAILGKWPRIHWKYSCVPPSWLELPT